MSNSLHVLECYQTIGAPRHVWFRTIIQADSNIVEFATIKFSQWLFRVHRGV